MTTYPTHHPHPNNDPLTHPNHHAHVHLNRRVKIKPSYRFLASILPVSFHCRWDVTGPEPVLEASFDGHADWVNDLAIIGDLLLTCSNDQTVRLWKAGSENGRRKEKGRGQDEKMVQDVDRWRRCFRRAHFLYVMTHISIAVV